MHLETTTNRTRLLIAIIAAVIWFALLGYRDLVDPDEGRYAEIPREMVTSGDWLTPRLNGYKYFEKPPLQYWMTAIGFELFGQGAATARLWTVSCGFACALFIWLLGARLYDADTGFYGFIITASGLMFVIQGHILTLDTALSFFVVLGVGCLALAQSQRDNPKRVRNWMLAGWAALAGAMMTKGLIGLVLPAGAVVVYSLWQRDWLLWKHLHLGKGLALFALLVVPWFLAVSLVNPEFARFFFIHEHFERYTSTVHNRDGSIFYFVPYLVAGMAPWVVVALKALFRPGFGWSPGVKNEFDSNRFLWVFVVLTFLFFSMGHSKLPGYILPVMPVLALLAARQLADRPGFRGDAWILALLAGLFLALGIAMTRFADDNTPIAFILAYRNWVIAAAAALCLGAVFLFMAPRYPLRNTAIAGLLAMLGFQFVGWGYQEMAALRSTAEIAASIKANDLADAPIYSVSKYPHSLSFYLGKTIKLVDHMGELEMGIMAEPGRQPATRSQFIRQWRQEVQAVALLKRPDYEKFNALGLPMRVIYQSPRKLVVARR